MEKIKITLTNSQMDVITPCLELIFKGSMPKNRYAKVTCSALMPIAKKIISKRINDFPPNKQFKFSLQAFEAHYLEEFLRYCLESFETLYESNTLQKIANDINEKLA